MNRLLKLSPLVLVLAFGGCGKPKPEVVQTAPKPEIRPTESTVEAAKETKEVTAKEVKQSAAADTAEKNATQTPLVATAAKGTAEATFQQVLIAFQDGQLDTAFDFLPASYQADVESLLHEFANKMDAEVWSKGFDTLTKFARVMKEKRNLVLNSELVKRTPQFQSIIPQWDAIVSTIQDVATSEVNNLDSLKHADLKHLLQSGSELLHGMSLPKFGNVTVTTVKSDRDTATLSYRESQDGELKTVEFVKIENKWLPKTIASAWATGISDAKARLASLPKRIASFKSGIMTQLKSFDSTLDKMQQAKNTDEFNVALTTLIFSAGLAFKNAQQSIQEATMARLGNSVRFEINRELKVEEQAKLKDAVVAGLDGTVDYELVNSEGKTRCRFTPVPDTSVLIDILKKHFEGATVRPDAEKKIIVVELK